MTCAHLNSRWHYPAFEVGASGTHAYGDPPPPYLFCEDCKGAVLVDQVMLDRLACIIELLKEKDR